MNPAYINEAALDVDEVNPRDLAPLVSGNAPIITAPASEVRGIAEDTIEDENMDEDNDVLLRTMQEVMDRLAELNQELESMVSSTLEDTSTQEHIVFVDPNVNAWDSRKAWEWDLAFIPKQAGRRFAPRFMSGLESCSTDYRSGLTSIPGIG